MSKSSIIDRAAPMPSAPMRYNTDGSVDWGNMWDSFCVLALDGGPPHRPSMLHGQEQADPTSSSYQQAVAEICRAVPLVCGLVAEAAEVGWVAIECPSDEMAIWLREAIMGEGVDARSNGRRLLVPCGESWSLAGEIKNVVTAVAKTTHYYEEHLPPEVKQTLRWQRRLARLGKWMRK